ncbi:hypothetical protein FHP05_13220 [Cerasibacillus terrae]|uniref:Uncharacterized protein n=1 Tax=Cerasibacillus terrae TaxID=2498845 RepID=A0A5C8NIC2_9BACI|nr:hypothetical protein [Cerasibacillus terrae]TXL61644.1 hypothetical protein FHP05_13220 [Cerasibacillus terrae]
MRRRQILYVVLSVVIIITTLIFVINYKFNQTDKEVAIYNNQVELLFGKNFISHVMDDGQSMTFNIFGVQKVTDQGSLTMDLIASMELDNPQLEIVNYDLSLGETYEEYQFFNILTKIKIDSDDIEEANNLIINFKSNGKKTYDIGKIILKNNKGYTNGRIQPKGEYTVGYPDFSLDFKLISDQNVSITKVADLTGLFSHEFDEQIQITKDEPKHFDVSSFKVEKENFDFYTVTPILHYKVGKKEYLYNLPSVLYGIMGSEIELIKRIIDANE